MICGTDLPPPPSGSLDSPFARVPSETEQRIAVKGTKHERNFLASGSAGRLRKTNGLRDEKGTAVAI